MYSLPNPAPQYLDSGKPVLGTNFIDDSQLLTHNPGNISRIVVYAKKFLWGLQIFYVDGSSTGLHNGFMEPGVNPDYRELALSPGEYITQISGYAGEHIGAIHITTNFGKALDIGSMPLGNLFSIQLQGSVIQKIVCGYAGYLNYIGAYLIPNPVSSYTLPSSIANSTAGYAGTPYPDLNPEPYRATAPPLMHSASVTIGSLNIFPTVTPATGDVGVEYSAMYGKSSDKDTTFNDYEDVVKPALKAGFKVRISRIKIYKKDGILLGIKPVYEITDKAGKSKKEERPHYSKQVGFFTSREAMNFKNGDYLSHITGKSKDKITRIKIVSSNHKDIIEYGINEGSEFLMIPKSGTGIIALAGSFNTCLKSLRSYSLR